MIKFEGTEVFGWEAAIKGMRNPLASWDRSDSGWNSNYGGAIIVDVDVENNELVVGKNDQELMKKLVKAGKDHRKFMRMIHVQADVTAPIYWWKEFDTYKIGTVRNSTSTMHKIHSKEFTLDDFSHEKLLNISRLEKIVDWLNEYREIYVNWDDSVKYVGGNGVELNKKDIWWQLIQLLPSSYNQMSTIDLNYEVLANMYHSRKAHKLDEWRVGFTEWVEALPFSELITGEVE